MGRQQSLESVLFDNDFGKNSDLEILLEQIAKMRKLRIKLQEQRREDCKEDGAWAAAYGAAINGTELGIRLALQELHSNFLQKDLLQRIYGKTHEELLTSEDALCRALAKAKVDAQRKEQGEDLDDPEPCSECKEKSAQVVLRTLFETSPPPDDEPPF